jgi:aminotransferase in exopolysaccharide biosynthesis
MFEEFVNFVQEQYKSRGFIPLHAPVFYGQEIRYVVDTIESTFVSSVGAYVGRFETEMATYTSSPFAVATVNGTAALHIALKLVGVTSGDLVITQPLTFVATCNAIAYCCAEPVFVDVDRQTLGLSPESLETWLMENAYLDDDEVCRCKNSLKVIRACLPMHTFGHPADLDGLLAVCTKWNLALVEDAAESLGSFYKQKHTGTFGKIGVLSFNGNKIITTGGGGMILTNDVLATRAKHLTTTAKQSHPYEYVHDEVGYNYRLPNINAALGCAQLEQLEAFVEKKRELAKRYFDFFAASDLQFITEPPDCRSNYWLNAVVCKDREHRDSLLTATNSKGVMTRPIWALMSRLQTYKNCRMGPLRNAEWLEDRIVNIPSSVR